ncbi:MAG: hypothetical protein KAH44_18160 [Oricola sp.]|jgi:hypothetical protein|nr:hypothetical protein [Oricola sp.]
MNPESVSYAGRKDPEFHRIDDPNEYWRGRVVSTKRAGGPEYGHIVRFARNSTNEVNVVVIWEDGEERQIHPAHLTLY